MKTKTNFFQKVFLLIFLIRYIGSQINNSTIWNEESLSLYLEKNFLQSNEKNNANFQYLLIDPEQSLNEQSKISLQKIFKAILNEYNINNIIFLLKSIDNSFDKKNLENLIIEKKIKLNLDLENLIITLISTSEPKIFIITGNKIKEKISDSSIENLHQNIEKNIKTVNKSEISRIIVDYYENIINILKTNNKKSKNFFLRYKGIAIFVTVIIIIIMLIKFFSGESNDFPKIILQKETKIISFLKQNKNRTIKEITNKMCIICLNDYNNDEQSKINKSSDNLNSDISRERKSSIDSSDNVTKISDKIHLPCKHVFHVTCLTRWKIYENKCPLCGAVIVFDSKNTLKINKFYPNKNWMFNEESKFRLVIEEFMRIQKTFYPHLVHSSFATKMVNDYKVKFEKEPAVIFVSPENLICKTLPSEDRNESKYNKLETSTQMSTDEKRGAEKKK